MATKIYGASDDLIRFEGDISEEVGAFKAGDMPFLVAFDDGTILSVGYGKPEGGIWDIRIFNHGTLFDRRESCYDSGASPHSDVVYMKDGVKRVFIGRDWEVVE